MNRRALVPCTACPGKLQALPGRASRNGILLALILGGLLATLIGCTEPQIRAQREEENDHERYPVKLVGDVCTFDNAAPIPISGVGLVEDLDGTGGPAPPGNARQALENELKKQRVSNYKQILASPDHSMVLVTALVPPGARKGDRLDLEVTLPPGSRTTSLRGGRLLRCALFNYAAVGQINPAYANSNATLRGHCMARAEGSLLVGFAGGASERLKQGRIWGGGVCLIDRPFHIILNSRHQFAKVAGNLANRINVSFQSGLPGSGTEVASAKNNTLIVLGMPPQYRHNPQRYLRVIRLVPLEDDPPPAEGRQPYRLQLQEDLRDPARTVVAALRLEALGAASVSSLTKGLQNPHPLVRFCSAEALAYLGNPACADELGRTVREQPYLRAYALTALASLDEAACRDRLFDLLGSDLDDETRYGAFRALRALDERDDAVEGEMLGDSFWLHRVAPGSPSLVHVSLGKRAEIVLFGDGHVLAPPFSILAGDFAITAGPDDQRCTISHFSQEAGAEGGSRLRCSLQLADVLRALASQGGSYSEALEVIRQADECRSLSCRVRQDALPQAVSVKQLAEAGKKAPGQTVDGIEIVKPDREMGGTPALYQASTPRRRATTLDSDARLLQHEPKSTEGQRAAQRR